MHELLGTRLASFLGMRRSLLPRLGGAVGVDGRVECLACCCEKSNGRKGGGGLESGEESFLEWSVIVFSGVSTAVDSEDSESARYLGVEVVEV